MPTYADKKQENKNQSVATAVSQRKSSANATAQLVDNRPEGVTQRKQQEMANNYAAQQQTIQRKENDIIQLQQKDGIYEVKKKGVLRKDESPKYPEIRKLIVSEKYKTEAAPVGAKSKFKLDSLLSSEKEHTWCKPITFKGSPAGWVNDEKITFHSEPEKKTHITPADFSHGTKNDETLPGEFRKKFIEQREEVGLQMASYHIGEESKHKVAGVAGCAAIRVSVVDQTSSAIVISGWLHSGGGTEGNGVLPLMNMLKGLSSQLGSDERREPPEYMFKFKEVTRTNEGAKDHAEVESAFIAYCDEHKIKYSVEKVKDRGDGLYAGIEL